MQGMLLRHIGCLLKKNKKNPTKNLGLEQCEGQGANIVKVKVVWMRREAHLVNIRRLYVK